MEQGLIDSTMLRFDAISSGHQSAALLQKFEQFIQECQDSTDKNVSNSAKLLSAKHGLDLPWPTVVEENILMSAHRTLSKSFKLIKGGKA